MSRLDELKKQYPELNVSLLDILKEMDKSGTYKYLPLMCKILGQRFKISYMHSHENQRKVLLEIESSLKSYGIENQNLKPNQLYAIRELLGYFNQDSMITINEFMKLNEMGLIDNNDVTSYSSIDDIRYAVSLSTLKRMKKELESQIHKEYEDANWVLVRPLTFESSSKYGSGTKWCTTYQQEKQYFERYWRNGILVYCINKKTGYKFAIYKNLSERDTSFWNAADIKVDFMDLEIEDYLYPIIKHILKSTQTNRDLSNLDIRRKVNDECLNESMAKSMVIEMGIARSEEPALNDIANVDFREPISDEDVNDLRDALTHQLNSMAATPNGRNVEEITVTEEVSRPIYYEDGPTDMVYRGNPA